MTRFLKPTILFIFFLSGITGLVYEVIWAKFLVLFIGNTTYAHTIVIAVFMGGLAIGNYLFGRRVDRMPQKALFLYGILEIGIGLYALIYPLFFDFIKENLFIRLASGLLGSPWIMILKFALSFLTMILPTILMGGTLPTLTKFFVRYVQETKKEVARLYFLNSLGAVGGCLVGGFFLIPIYGLSRPVFLAGMFNIILGILVLLIDPGSRAMPAMVKPEKGVPESKEPGPGGGVRDFTGSINWLFLAVALSGAVAMIYEIAWIRLLSMVTGSSTYSFSVMLIAFISGIALGALIMERISDRIRRHFLIFGLLEIGIALSVAITLPFYERLPYDFLKIRFLLVPSLRTFWIYESLKFFFCLLLMIVPTTLSGMALPLVSHLASRKIQLLGRSVGSVFSWNTAGTVVGTIMAGLVLLPAFGVRRTIEIGSFVSLATGIIVLLLVQPIPRIVRGSLITVPSLILVLFILLSPPWDPLVMQSGGYRLGSALLVEDFSSFKENLNKGYVSVFYREGLNDTVSVEKYFLSNLNKSSLVLKINGKADASQYGDLSTQLLAAHLPMALHPNPEKIKKVMLIGLGSGITLGAVLRHPVERVDLIEISPAVIEAARYFNEDNHHALEDPRTHIHLDDARTFFYLADQKYDLIISEPSNPWISGIGNLFTEEYYRSSLSHLNEDGIFAQWFHTYEQSDGLVQVILKTFLNSFPDSTLWHTQGNDYLLLGSKRALEPDWERVKSTLSAEKVQKDLGRIQLSGVPALLSLQTHSNSALKKIANKPLKLEAKEAPINRDYRPILEYQSPKAFYVAESASLLADSDERRKRTGEGLWISRYIREKGLTSEDYRRIYQFSAEALVGEEDQMAPLLESLLQRDVRGATLDQSILEAWLRQYPEDPLARNEALQKWHRENPFRALALLEAKERKYLKDPELVRWKGILSYQLEGSRSSLFYQPHLEDAEQSIKKAAESAPANRLRYRLLLGKIYEALSDPDRAISLYLDLLNREHRSDAGKGDSDDMLIYRLLSQVYRNKGDIEKSKLYSDLADKARRGLLED